MSPMSPMLLKCRTEDGGTRSAIPLQLDEQLSPMMDRPCKYDINKKRLTKWLRQQRVEILT